MANFTFPSRDVDSPDQLVSLLGSFWQNVYTADDQVLSYANARGQAERQKTINLQEALDAIGRSTVPVFHTDLWHLLRIKESDRNATEPDLLSYGDDHVTSPAVYGKQVDGFQYYYGEPFERKTSSFPIPSGLRRAPWIFNKISAPEVSLAAGLDYYLDLSRQLIVLRGNPFENSGFPITDVYEGETLVDRQIDLWIYQAALDWEYVWNHFGYILGIDLPSGEPYKRLVNSVFDGVVEGTATKHISEAIAAITDTAVVRDESEVVEEIVRDERHLLIITDAHVYRFNKSASSAVAVGQTVQQYDQLVDTVKFYEFNRGMIESDLLALEIPPDLLIGDYYGGIVFQNKNVPLEVSSDGVFTRVEFEIGGFPGDIVEFWDTFHSRGVATPPTLAQLLDRRTNKVGEPSSAALPATINPLEFLAENILRHHVYVVKLKLNQFGPEASGIEQIRHLRELIPPQTAMLIVVELAADTDIVTMEGPGTETEPGYSEGPVLGIGNSAPTETIDPSVFVSEQPKLTYTAGRCL